MRSKICPSISVIMKVWPEPLSQIIWYCRRNHHKKCWCDSMRQYDLGGMTLYHFCLGTMSWKIWCKSTFWRPKHTNLTSQVLHAIPKTTPAFNFYSFPETICVWHQIHHADCSGPMGLPGQRRQHCGKQSLWGAVGMCVDAYPSIHANYVVYSPTINFST